MVTSSALPGTPLAVQFPAVFQSVLIDPFQVLAAANAGFDVNNDIVASNSAAIAPTRNNIDSLGATSCVRELEFICEFTLSFYLASTRVESHRSIVWLTFLLFALT